jgi:hypothetical protein
LTKKKARKEGKKVANFQLKTKMMLVYKEGEMIVPSLKGKNSKKM